MPSHDVAIVLRGVMNYQVNCHYNYNDLGIYCNVETAEDGSIAQPADPTVDGLTFAGWYDNAACEGTPFDFSQKLSANINLYADWRVNVRSGRLRRKRTSSCRPPRSEQMQPEN